MRKKVLFFANALYGGGAERILQIVLKNLGDSTYDITLYSLHKETLSDLYPSNIKYHYIYDSISKEDSFFKKFYVRLCNKLKLLIYYHFSARWFYYLFVKGNYDTEVAFIEGDATRIVSGSTNRKSKKIAWVHIDLKNNHWTKIAYRTCEEEKNSYEKFDKVECVSETVRQSFLELFCRRKVTEVCYNPIDEHLIRNLALERNVDRELLSSRFTMISVGRLVAQKGYDRLLKVVRFLKEEGYVFSLNILGEGFDRKQLEQYIKDNKLNDCVRLIGFCKNPYVYLKQADLFVCSSRSEGYSTVVTESLILGIPVVATNCSGMYELLGNNEYGLVTENNEQGLMQGILKMMNNESVYQHYKHKAIERGQHFSLKVLMSNIETIL